MTLQFQMLQKIHLWILGITLWKRGIEQDVSWHGGVESFGVTGIIEARVGRAQQADVPSRRAAARDDAIGVHAQIIGMLLEPTNRDQGQKTGELLARPR